MIRQLYSIKKRQCGGIRKSTRNLKSTRISESMLFFILLLFLLTFTFADEDAIPVRHKRETHNKNANTEKEALISDEAMDLCAPNRNGSYGTFLVDNDIFKLSFELEIQFDELIFDTTTKQEEAIDIMTGDIQKILMQSFFPECDIHERRYLRQVHNIHIAHGQRRSLSISGIMFLSASIIGTECMTAESTHDTHHCMIVETQYFLSVDPNISSSETETIEAQFSSVLSSYNMDDPGIFGISILENQTDDNNQTVMEENAEDDVVDEIDGPSAVIETAFNQTNLAAEDQDLVSKNDGEVMENERDAAKAPIKNYSSQNDQQENNFDVEMTEHIKIDSNQTNITSESQGPEPVEAHQEKKSPNNGNSSEGQSDNMNIVIETLEGESTTLSISETQTFAENEESEPSFPLGFAIAGSIIGVILALLMIFPKLGRNKEKVDKSKEAVDTGVQGSANTSSADSASSNYEYESE